MGAIDIKAVVKEKYGQGATRVQSGGVSCCGTGPVLQAGCDPITSDLYSTEDAAEIPDQADDCVN